MSEKLRILTNPVTGFSPGVAMVGAMLSVMFLTASIRAGDLPDEAGSAYQAALALAEDSERARPLFRRSAELYERLWREQALDSPGLHRNRAQAYLLSGDLANALRAYHEGRERWPADPDLQYGQASARARVLYPSDGRLRERAAPPSPWRMTEHIAPRHANLLGAGCYIVGWVTLSVALLRRREFWWYTSCLSWIVAGLVMGVSAWESHERETASPLVVIARDGVAIREGNATAFPRVIEEELVTGIEASLLHQRGDWSRIRLADGTEGWVPDSVLIVEVNPGSLQSSEY